MKNILAGLALLSLAACHDNSQGADKPLYDTTAKSTEQHAPSPDSLVQAAGADSVASKDSSSKSAATKTGATGGTPAGTIDSGMTNAGAQHHHSSKHH